MEIKVKSKKHGKHTILLDDEDYEKVNNNKWSILRAKNGLRYYAVCIKKGTTKYLYMHKLIMEGNEIDHINHNGLDNRKSNLRICSRTQNNFNRRKRNNCSSKYKGVTFDKARNKWHARCKVNGRQYILGRFKTEIEAAIAYNNKAKELYGPFALLNDLHI